jgi:hypothetical protein
MESTATRTSARARFCSQFSINLQKKLKKVWVLQEGVAHLDGLLSWKTRDSPKGFVCSSSLRGIFSAPSRYLTGSAEKAIGIGDPTQVHQPQQRPS